MSVRVSVIISSFRASALPLPLPSAGKMLAPCGGTVCVGLAIFFAAGAG
jgi:hypothetical protein